MYDSVTSKQRQTPSDAVRRSTRCRQWKSAIISPFQRLIEIYPERLEHDARMTSKLEVIHHANDVTLTVRVRTRQQIKHSNFVEGLASEPVFTADDLHCYPTTSLVVERPDYLTETATTKYLEYLVAGHTTINDRDLHKQRKVRRIMP